MEPLRQVEIQLGHMCNNRCVFCVSGQRTERREAGVLPGASAIARIEEAFASGHRKITMLGGEPTLQPDFIPIVQRTVELGFEEIVIFTNGVRTARMEFVDEVLATGGNFVWRISIQGGTEEAHVRTTQRPNSFQRILRTLRNLRAREQVITVNMCVVVSNYASVPGLADICAEYGVRQLHLDLVRPLDAGERTDAEFEAMIPNLASLADPYRELARRVDELAPDLDLNFGNLPFCIAPELIDVVHHDGERTDTIAVDHQDELSQPWNKYLVKRRDKVHPSACGECLMRDACSGVYEAYATLHGVGMLAPIDAATLLRVDPERTMFARHLRPLARALRRSSTDAIRVTTRELSEGPDSRLMVSLQSDEARMDVELGREGADARFADFAARIVDQEGANAPLIAHLQAVLPEPIQPFGARPSAPSVRARLRALSRAAPFEALRWTRTEATPDGVVVHLRDPDGVGARVRLEHTGGRAIGGYEVDADTPAVRAGLRAALAAFHRR